MNTFDIVAIVSVLVIIASAMALSSRWMGYQSKAVVVTFAILCFAGVEGFVLSLGTMV